MSKLVAAKPCAGCGHTEFTRDFLATAGDILCLQCGMVQIENPIVSEVQFGESSSGAATVQGAMVGPDQARVYNMRNSLESREQTLMNAKGKIKLLAASMRIPDYIQESAHGWFKLALVQNFVQGRRSQNVIAACLYVACRHEKTPHLLIDFSSRLQISVYSLGATYLKLVRALLIQRLPLADPSLFIQHFAEKLNFAEHTAKVCRDATKIAQRMSSDWIYEGRRPAGIAGACLLLAARMNNFRRSHAELMAVARIGEETLQKRLNEFKKTTSALLSVLEFRESSHTNDSQPPSFRKNRAIEAKIEKLLQQRRNTLRKYQELAKNRRLYMHLSLVRHPTGVSEGKEETEKQGDGEDGEGAENAQKETQKGVEEDEDLSSSSEDEAQSPEVVPTRILRKRPAAPAKNDKKGGENSESRLAESTGTAKASQLAGPAEPAKQTESVKMAETVESAKQTESPAPHAFPASSETNEHVSVGKEPGLTEKTAEENGPHNPSNEGNDDDNKNDESSTDSNIESSSDDEDPQPTIQLSEYTNPWGYVRPDLQIWASVEDQPEEEKTGNKLRRSRRKIAEKEKALVIIGAKDKAKAKPKPKSKSKYKSKSKSGRGKHRSDDEEEVNELFVPATDDEEGDALGYDDLPDNPDDADEDYEEHHQKIVSLRQKSGRATAKKGSSRLGSISDTPKTGRRRQVQADEIERMKQKEKAAALKRQKEKRKAEEMEAREDELMKAVLSGGDIKEEDLEIALDRILQGQSKTFDGALYKTPAEMQNETDFEKQVKLDRPRNLVKNNPTTQEILAKVRDDEILNTDDEDEEVLSVQLTEAEKAQKERIWISLNHDFLIAQERKRLKIEADELTGNTSGQPRKRRKIKQADPILDDEAVADAIHLIGEGNKMVTPAENAKQMLQKKLFSRKINYSSIGDLFNE